METVKDILNFCNAAVFYDYKNIGIIEGLSQAGKCIINNFHKTTPVDRIQITLSILDVVILKSNDSDNEKVIENIHDLREIILHMLSFEKVIREKEEAN